jgi:hypothetical protein
MLPQRLVLVEGGHNTFDDRGAAVGVDGGEGVRAGGDGGGERPGQVTTRSLPWSSTSDRSMLLVPTNFASLKGASSGHVV